MRSSCFILALIVCLAPTSFCRGQFGPANGPKLPLDKQLTQRWQVGAVIRAIGGPCKGLTGTISVPAAWPEQEVKIVDEQISPLVRGVSYREQDGLRQMVFNIPQIPSGQTATALVTFEVTKSSILAPENPERFVVPQNLPQKVRPYLGPSPMIDCRHNSIRDKAKQLVADKETAWAQVEAIYDWVRENVKYQDGKTKGALEALREGKGDKHDLTSLFIALCRAHKVPARTVWIPDHVYAEFYLEDPDGKGAWFPCQVAGTRDFGCLSDLRPVLQKGENFKIPEKKESQRFVAEFLTGQGGKNAGQPQVEFVRKLLPAN
ncbi:MAG: transglutaminase-like domain-containing protein [Planctomycetota bacterium]|nr:transglutaminase-like domain-containing protein [Planctomycetota bacterium]